MRLFALALCVALGGCQGCKRRAPKAGDPDVEKPSTLRQAAQLEVKMALRQLYDASVSYYQTEHTSRAGEILPAQFPASTALTPAVDCCQQPGEVCAVDPNAWSGETWNALSFQLSEPSRYRYEYVGNGASFIARAVGVPGCIAAPETWEAGGHGGANGSVTPDSPTYVRRVQ